MRVLCNGPEKSPWKGHSNAMGLYSQELITTMSASRLSPLPLSRIPMEKETDHPRYRSPPSGVGKSTVSRVLNQDPKVNAQTRGQGRAGDRPNTVSSRANRRGPCAARASRWSASCVAPDSSSENQAVRGMLETLYQRGYDAVLMESKFSPPR